MTSLRFLVPCCLCVIAFDSVASSISVTMKIPYENFVIPQCVMYILIGVALALYRIPLRITATTILATAIAECSVGAAIAFNVGAMNAKGVGFITIAASCALSTLFLTLIGLLASVSVRVALHRRVR
jgi:hypothetical protein